MFWNLSHVRYNPDSDFHKETHPFKLSYDEIFFVLLIKCNQYFPVILFVVIAVFS